MTRLKMLPFALCIVLFPRSFVQGVEIVSKSVPSSSDTDRKSVTNSSNMERSSLLELPLTRKLVLGLPLPDPQEMIRFLKNATESLSARTIPGEEEPDAETVELEARNLPDHPRLERLVQVGTPADFTNDISGQGEDQLHPQDVRSVFQDTQHFQDGDDHGGPTDESPNSPGGTAAGPYPFNRQAGNSNDQQPQEEEEQEEHDEQSTDYTSYEDQYEDGDEPTTQNYGSGAALEGTTNFNSPPLLRPDYSNGFLTQTPSPNKGPPPRQGLSTPLVQNNQQSSQHEGQPTESPFQKVMHLVKSINNGQANFNTPQVVQMGEYAVSVAKIPEESSSQESVFNIKDGHDHPATIILRQNFYVNHGSNLEKRSLRKGDEVCDQTQQDPIRVRTTLTRVDRQAMPNYGPRRFRFAPVDRQFQTTRRPQTFPPQGGFTRPNIRPTTPSSFIDEEWLTKTTFPTIRPTRPTFPTTRPMFGPTPPPIRPTLRPTTTRRPTFRPTTPSPFFDEEWLTKTTFPTTNRPIFTTRPTRPNFPPFTTRPTRPTFPAFTTTSRPTFPTFPTIGPAPFLDEEWIRKMNMQAQGGFRPGGGSFQPGGSFGPVFTQGGSRPQEGSSPPLSNRRGFVGFNVNRRNDRSRSNLDTSDFGRNPTSEDISSINELNDSQFRSNGGGSARFTRPLESIPGFAPFLERINALEERAAPRSVSSSFSERSNDKPVFKGPIRVEATGKK